jgi:MurNAc alpha-1-phosphate uridylyltransferase
MTPPILLFAAGLGTRMGALVTDQPKPLLNVAGRPLIDHALELTAIPGVGRKVVNVHYRGDMIRQHLVDQDILFSDESKMLLETGGGLRHALTLLQTSPVLTMNTDAVWQGPNPITQVLNAWRDEMEALLLIVPKDQVSGHLGKGDFEIEPSGKLRRAPGAIYTGVQMIRTDCFDDITEHAFSMNLVWDQIAARGGLYGAVYDGNWCDVGQPSSIPIAEAMLDV